MKRLSTLLLLFVAFAFSAFTQTMNQVVVSFDHQVGADPLVLDQTVFPIWNTKKVKLSRAEFYISEVEIHHPDGTMMPLTDQYLLVNANAPTTEFDLGTWPVEAAHGVTLHLGVPQAVNHNDPAAWPDSHPLAPKDPSMHWGWAGGYRFLVLEGQVDNNGDGVPETDFEFHSLGDALYKTIEVTGMKEAENGVLHLHFVLDYTQLFKNVAMTGNLIQHGSAILNQKLMINGATANFVTMPSVSATHDVVVNSLNVKVSPNPANTETMLEYAFPAVGTLHLVMTNTLGQTVRSFTNLAPSASIRLETNTLPVGIYQYAFYENGSLLARKQLVVKH